MRTPEDIEESKTVAKELLMGNEKIASRIDVSALDAEVRVWSADEDTRQKELTAEGAETAEQMVLKMTDAEVETAISELPTVAGVRVVTTRSQLEQHLAGRFIIDLVGDNKEDGHYNPVLDRITVKNSAQTKPGVLVHEYVHAATSDAFRQAFSTKGKSKEQAAEMNALTEAATEYIANMVTDVPLVDESGRIVGFADVPAYGSEVARLESLIANGDVTEEQVLDAVLVGDAAAIEALRVAWEGSSPAGSSTQ